jgi:prolyl oligopeptidase
MSELKYPFTRKTDQVDNYHGTRVADPYRWLEDVDAPETLEWIMSQNALTFAYLEQIPARAQIRQRLTNLWDYARAQAPHKRGGRYFQLRNSGLQNQDVIVVLDSLESEPRWLLDPNTLSEDGTVALNTWSVSPDGCWLAYSVSVSGSDWQTWKIRNVDSGEDLPDQIEWSKFSEAEWQPDSHGFYYGRYDPPQAGQEYQDVNYCQKLYFHRLGDLQQNDRLVYERPDQKEWGFSPRVTEDGRYLILSIWQGTDSRNRLFYIDLQTGDETQLVEELEAAYQFVGNDGSLFYLYTDLDSPRGRLVAVDTAQPDRQNWKTLLPEDEDVLEGIKMGNDQFVVLYMHNAAHQIRLFKLDGAPAGEIRLPMLGSLFRYDDLGIHCQRGDHELFYAFQSFTFPTTVFRYDFKENLTQVLFKPAIDFDPQAFETHQVIVTSKDGTRVPMFLVHRPDLQINGQNPTLLYGYGGFNIPILPNFALGWLVWLEMGGVLAVANLRGGGEYGEEWHKAGMVHSKQNVFDDFIACAEYLISSGITTPSKLAIHGRSNGGLLVGACLTQRPDLFGAALPAVGVMDMLRFHQFTIGWAWVSDYGTVDDPQQFESLYAYSPLHNLQSGKVYPATLVTTGDHDDRVVPGHSFKFIAALQAAQAGPAPILIRIQTKAGHGFGKPTAILIQELADQWAFLVKTLGLEVSLQESGS